MRLRTSLLLLVLATAVPLLAFGLVASALLVQHEQDNFIAAVQSRNRAFMSAVDAELKGTIATLRALAAARSLDRDDVAAFHEQAAAVLATQPSWVNVVLHDVQGRQLASASRPWGGPLPTDLTQSESFARVLETREPAIGDLIARARTEPEPGVPIRIPVLREGQVAYVLTAVLKPAAFEPLIRNQHLPEGWASGLVDAKGQLIARVPPRPVGTMASADYLAHSRASPEGWYRGETLDGTDTFTAFTTSELSRWSVGYAIPATLVLAGTLRSAWLMGGGVLASLAIAAAIALWLGRRIARPMSALAAAAPALGTGRASPEVSTRIREVAALADELRQADLAIRARDEELRRSAAELRRADANKSQFLAVLSHELRNPLAPLLNGVTILRRLRDAQAVEQTQQMMERQIGQLRRLIDDLLDVSRIDLGKLGLQRERVAIDAVVREAIETAKPGIEAKRLELVVRYAAAPLYVDGDPVRLSQVVANLLGNAAKFTPAGGRIEIAMRIDGAEAAVSVRDTGIGFAPAESKRIFDMFEQLDARGSHAGGLGLGLTLARQLVEMHGGRIAAASDGPGRGAEFTFWLPLAAAPAAAAAAARTAPAAAGSRRVLVVDDNTDAADTLTQLLRLEGCEVLACYDGERALAAAQAFRPDVAFLDLNMPGLGGLELAGRLRASAGGRPLRLVALTGMGQKGDLEATRAAGFDAHLTKPAPAEDVLRLVRESAHVLPFRSEKAS